MKTQRLTLMAVHAHPDDEAIATGGILARYAAEGIYTVLVTCTHGELGEVQDPAYVPPAPDMGITEIREQEMAHALELLKIHRYYNLGYKDSGMAGTSGNNDPAAFTRTDVEEAARRLAGLIRREKPQVIVTYDENGVYGHPDHIMANTVTQRAFAMAGDANVKTDNDASPWQPAKLYYIAIPLTRLKGHKTPIIGTPEEQITTRIDVTSVLDRKMDAIFAHESQFGPSHRFRLLSADQQTAIFGSEHFVCIYGCDSTVTEKESDIFQGLRA